MAQEPATPKLRRLWLRALARVLGPRFAQRHTTKRSETAALTLRASPISLRKRAEMVTFLIPLVGPEPVDDWDAVTDRLQATLQSLISQNNPNWRAVICCQQRPPMPADDRLSFLAFDDPEPGNDKWRKLSALCAHMPSLPPMPGYIMTFDADDILRQGTVSEMLSEQARGGYLVQSGYVMDHATGDFALAGKPSLSQPLRKPFWKLCGSCAALRHDPDQPLCTDFLQAMTQHEHRMFPYLAALGGQRLTPLARPSVLYVLNHGENFGARRGRVGFKTRFVQRFKITDVSTLETIAKEFPAP